MTVLRQIWDSFDIILRLFTTVIRLFLLEKFVTPSSLRFFLKDVVEYISISETSYWRAATQTKDFSGF